MLGLQLDDRFVRGHLGDNVADLDPVADRLVPLLYGATFKVSGDGG